MILGNNVRQVSKSLLLTFITVTMTMASCSYAPEEAEVPEVRIPSVKSLYPSTLEEATEWQPDAYLYWVILELDELNMNGTFGYRSANDPSAYLLVSVEDEGSGLEISTQSNSFGSPKSQGPFINLAEFPFDSADAWAIGLSNGITDYFEDAPRGLSHSMIIQLIRKPNNEEGVITWQVSLLSEGYRSMHIYINAQTREVIEVRDFFAEGGS